MAGIYTSEAPSRPQSNTKAILENTRVPDDRKEVIEYLRHLQKRDEAKAITSGLTGWVLFGALAYTTNWLIDHFKEETFRSDVFNGLAAALLLILLWMSLAGTRRETENLQKPRIARLGQLAKPSRLVTNLLSLVVVLMPLTASQAIFGWTIPVLYSSFFAVVSCIGLIIAPLCQIFGIKIPLTVLINKGEKEYPIFEFLALIALGFHAHDIYKILVVTPPQRVAVAAHILVAWWVILSLMRMRESSSKSGQYGKLEDGLMFGVHSSSEVLEILEAEALGPTLESELGEFNRKISSAMLIYEQVADECKKDFDEIKTIPQNYTKEIEARSNEAHEKYMSANKKIIGAIRLKKDYLASIVRGGSRNLNGIARDILNKELKTLEAKLDLIEDKHRSIAQDFQSISELRKSAVLIQ